MTKPIKPIASIVSTELKSWDTEATVRSRPYKYNVDKELSEFEGAQDWYPRSLLPFLSHSEVNTLAPNLIQLILAKHLIYFMEYTTQLEHRIVNGAIEALLYADLGVSIPASMKAAAMQLYTDEGYHALISYDVASQVRSIYGLADTPIAPRRIIDLETLITSEKVEHQDTIRILIGFVSETVIAKELAILSRSALVPAVYEVLQDHLDDEAKHSKFFSETFLYIWNNSSLAKRNYIEKTAAKILQIFFTADSAWLHDTLLSSGISQDTSHEIINDLNSPESISLRINKNAAVTLRTLHKAGINLQFGV